MPYVHDKARLEGLRWILENAKEVDICSSEPATFADIAKVSLGNRKNLEVSEKGTSVRVAPIIDGVTSSRGTVQYFVLHNGKDTIVAHAPVRRPQEVTQKNPWALEQIVIRASAAKVAQ